MTKNFHHGDTETQRKTKSKSKPESTEITEVTEKIALSAAKKIHGFAWIRHLPVKQSSRSTQLSTGPKHQFLAIAGPP